MIDELQFVTSNFFNKYRTNFETINEHFLQRATSATSSKGILKRVLNDFLQRLTSLTRNVRNLQRSTKQFLHQATSGTSPE